MVHKTEHPAKPVHRAVSILHTLRKLAYITLDVYDLLGRKVETLWSTAIPLKPEISRVGKLSPRKKSTALFTLPISILEGALLATFIPIDFYPQIEQV